MLCARVANDIGHAFAKRETEHVLLSSFESRRRELRADAHARDHQCVPGELELMFQTLRPVALQRLSHFIECRACDPINLTEFLHGAIRVLVGEPGCQVGFQDDHGQCVTEHVVHVTGDALTLTVSRQLPHCNRPTQGQRRHDGSRDSIPGDGAKERPRQAQSQFLDESQSHHAAHDQRDPAYVAAGDPSGERRRYDEEHPTYRIERCEGRSDQSDRNALPQTRTTPLPVQQRGAEQADEGGGTHDAERPLGCPGTAPHRIDEQYAACQREDRRPPLVAKWRAPVHRLSWQGLHRGSIGGGRPKDNVTLVMGGAHPPAKNTECNNCPGSKASNPTITSAISSCATVRRWPRKSPRRTLTIASGTMTNTSSAAP